MHNLLRLVFGLLLMMTSVDSHSDDSHAIAHALATKVESATKKISSKLAHVKSVLESEERERKHDLAFLKHAKCVRKLQLHSRRAGVS